MGSRILALHVVRRSCNMLRMSKDVRSKPVSGPGSRMRRYRARLRAEGFKPVQIWVHDTQAPGFANEARRQSLEASRRPSEIEMLEFMAHAFDSTEWN